MPRRSRARAVAELSEVIQTHFGEGAIDAKIREEKEATTTAKLRKRGDRPSTSSVEFSAAEFARAAPTALEKSNGERKIKPKEPKIRGGLLTDINRALLKNKEKTETKKAQTGGRIAIL